MVQSYFDNHLPFLSFIPTSFKIEQNLGTNNLKPCIFRNKTMNKTIKFITFALTISTSSVLANQSLISSLYCSALGTKDTDDKFIKIYHQALKDLGITDVESTTVKQMNAVGPLFVMNDLLSFTAFGGSWLNQEDLKSLPEWYQKFMIYHEASHYTQSHHLQTWIAFASSLVILIISLWILKKGFGTMRPLFKVSGLVVAGALLVLLWLKYLLPYIIKRQEKQADIMATQALIKTGNKNVVEQFIAMLKKSKNQDNGGLWWPSNNEIIKYLEESINEKN